MAHRYWTCRRCKYRNLRTASRTCQSCGSVSKPKTRRPAHMLALELPYEGYLELNERIHGVGEVCALCGVSRFELPAGYRLDRDHDHRTGNPRGLCCANCNMKLKRVDDLEWLAAALRYIGRAEVYWEQREVA